jgi:hypothetical protein
MQRQEWSICQTLSFASQTWRNWAIHRWSVRVPPIDLPVYRIAKACLAPPKKARPNASSRTIRLGLVYVARPWCLIVSDPNVKYPETILCLLDQGDLEQSNR